jgi:hypothetical protein
MHHWFIARRLAAGGGFFMRLTMRTGVLFGLVVALMLLPADTTQAGPGKNKIQTWMVNTGVDSDAKALVKHFTNAKRDRFTIKVKGLDLGTYDVMVDGTLKGSFDMLVDDDGSGTHGKIRWDEKKGKPLDFDPRGYTIDIAQADTVFLTCDFPTSQSDIMNLEFEVDLLNTGAVLGAEGEAEFRLHKGKMRFKVEIEDVPEGEYELRVDGVTVAIITALLDSGGDIEGEVKFSSNPSHEGKDYLLMTFDPRGKLIEVVDTSTDPETVLLSVVFPTVDPAP